MQYTTDKQDTLTILALQEENLNSLIAPELKSEFVYHRNDGVRNLILDLSKVKYVDSSGLSAILTANRIYKGFGSFVLTGVDSSAVRKLIEISRLDTILTIIPTLSEATDYVKMEELQRQLMEGEEE